MGSIAHSRILSRFLISLVAFVVAGAIFVVGLRWQGQRLSERLDERNRLSGLVQQRTNIAAQAQVTESRLRTIEGKLGAPLAVIKTALEQKLVASGREQLTATMQRVAQAERAALFLEQADEQSLNGQWQGSLESFAVLLRELARLRFVGQLTRVSVSALSTPAAEAGKTASVYRFTFTVLLP